MSQKNYPVPKNFSQQTLIDSKKYKEIYDFSIKSPKVFWEKEAGRLTWVRKWDSVQSTQFTKPVQIRWFEGAQLNVSVNCIDRHLPHHAEKVALIFEPDHPQSPIRKITYKELHSEVCLFANILKKMGVQKGDFVTIYLPMIPEAVFAMLACARIGAPHSVIFAGFAPDSISDRIQDCKSRFVITADGGKRGGKSIPLKENLDLALQKVPFVEKVLVIKNTSVPVSTFPNRDIWYHEVKSSVDAYSKPEPMNAEDPLFILYTSGSTGKPKGVLHTTAGYLLYASMTHEYVFDLHPNDIYWCTADIGWVTGHSYIVYGPLANATTSVLFEGVPTFPNASRFWNIIDKHHVSLFYTSPTAIRSLMREGDDFVKQTSRKSLRVLGSVGEPINPEAWNWYYNVIGNQQCPIVDTWWQTETGGILITPLPGAIDLKPGSATLPFFGIKPKLLTTDGKEIHGPGEGVLVLEDSWPGQMRTVYGDHTRFEETYFSTYPGYYFTGDGCKRDEDGYYWITGRVDDVINVSGHRLGTAEIESAFVAHHNVSEAAVVGYPHSIKGQGIYAFITLKAEFSPSDDLKKELIAVVRKEIGPIATPDLIQFAPKLPKTRSGKIMRRILRKIAENQIDQLGDTSTLAEPEVVGDLLDQRLNK